MVLTIDEIKEKIRPICEKYKVVKLFLFGSYARGEATEESDVDFYAVLPRGTGLIRLCGFRLDLEDALQKEVDVLTRIPEEYKIFKKHMERDEILLYEGRREGRPDIAGYTAAL